MKPWLMVWANNSLSSLHSCPCSSFFRSSCVFYCEVAYLFHHSRPFLAKVYLKKKKKKSTSRVMSEGCSAHFITYTQIYIKHSLVLIFMIFLLKSRFQSLWYLKCYVGPIKQYQDRNAVSWSYCGHKSHASWQFFLQLSITAVKIRLHTL